MIRSSSPLGVVVVTYNASDVILECLESLVAAHNAELHVVVVDNNSTDGTVDCIRGWAAGNTQPEESGCALFPTESRDVSLVFENSKASGTKIVLIEARVNGGFAAGVNQGLAYLAGLPEIDRFWILNPDSVVPPETPAILANCEVPAEGFSLIGGRIRYFDPPHLIQSDGAWVNRLTGVTGNINLGQEADKALRPQAEEMDFICGASMVASRAFYETAGPLPEEYFLYYEEVAWAQRRGNLPLVYCPEALVYHRAGTAIGSPTLAKVASPFSIYFMYRSRMIFIREHHPTSLPTAYAFAFAKAMQLAMKGYIAQAHALLRAIHGMGPSAEIRAKLSPEAARLAFGKMRTSTADAKVCCGEEG